MAASCPCCRNPGLGGAPCTIPPITVIVCRDVWQEKNDDGECVCKYDWMEKDEDGWCRNRDRPDSGGGSGGGNTGEGSEGDSITFIVRIDCRTALERSRTVTCAAETRNGVGTITYAWRYDPTGGGVRIWDRGTDFQTLDAKSETTTSKTWEGTAVHGGTVKVTATDEDGNEDTADTDFTVGARGWTIDGQAVRAQFTRYKPDLTAYFLPGAHLGFNTNASGSEYFDDILEGDGRPVDPSTAKVVAVASGPNQGYAYVKSQNYRVDRRYRLNERLDSAGPVETPDTTQGDTVNHWTYMARRGWNPQGLLDAVIRHESYGDGVAKGHQGQFELALTSSACGDAAKLVDRIVAKTVSAAEDLRDEVEERAELAFMKAGDHHNVHGHISSNIVLYDPNGTIPPQVIHFQDTATPDPYGTVPQCNWTLF